MVRELGKMSIFTMVHLYVSIEIFNSNENMSNSLKHTLKFVCNFRTWNVNSTIGVVALQILGHIYFINRKFHIDQFIVPNALTKSLRFCEKLIDITVSNSLYSNVITSR